MKGLWLAFFLFLLPITAVGQAVTVRGGEHDGFTRLVLDLPRQVSWSIETKDEMLLTLQGLSPKFDISSVMNKLSAGRVLAVNVGEKPSTLAVSLDCECEVESFYAGPTMLVIDLYGAPDGRPEMVTAADLTEEIVVDEDEILNVPPSFQLPLVLPSRATSRAKPVETIHSAPEGNLISDEQIERAQRSREAERSLLTEMGRVASQGLVEPHLTLPDVRKMPEEADGNVEIESPVPTLPEAPDGQNMRAFSSADRDFLLSQEASSINRNGQRCMNDEQLALRDWVSEDGFGKQTGVLRTRLFGEFDKPDPLAAKQLAQAYIGYGLGMEAAQVLKVIALPEVDSHLLAMADIVEDGQLTGAMPRTWHLDCETSASFWALLSGAQTRSDMPLNRQSVLRSFSALPAHIRAHLGPFLTERLQAIGEEDLLSDVVRHMGRGQPENEINLAIVSAQAEIVAGESENAVTELEKVVTANRESAPEALAQKIYMLAAEGQKVPARDVELIEAFALEYRQDPLSATLSRAAVLARASVGRFEGGFSDLVLLAPEIGQAALIEAASFILDRLSEVPEDLVFLEYAFSPEAEKLLFSTEAEHQAARRLIDLGFAGRAFVYLSSAAQAELGRARKLLRAEAALGLGRMRQAEAELLGLHGPDVEALRVKAKIGQQDYSAAQIVLETLGDSEAAAEQAWLAEDWTGLSALEAAEWESEQALLELDQATDREPTLANSEDLLREADELRGLVTGVLERHKMDPQFVTQ